MTVRELSLALNWPMAVEGADRPVCGGWCGDLLSHAMTHAAKNAAWITVMTNVNVAAVAVLRDVACIILADGQQPDQSLLDVAIKEKITIICTHEDVYTAAICLSQQLSRQKRYRNEIGFQEKGWTPPKKIRFFNRK